LKNGTRKALWLATFNAEVERNVNNRAFFVICGDVGHQGKVLYKTARLAFGCIGRTQDAKLRRLQGPGSTDFAGLLELRAGEKRKEGRKCQDSAVNQRAQQPKPYLILVIMPSAEM